MAKLVIGVLAVIVTLHLVTGKYFKYFLSANCWYLNWLNR